MAYHYHFLGTQNAYEDLAAFLTTRTTDRTLALQNKTSETGDRYVTWKLSKVEYTGALDAAIRVVEGLHRGLLLHVVTKADDALMPEFTANQHSNFDTRTSALATWEDRMQTPDSIFQIRNDLENLEGHLGVLAACFHSNFYAPLIEAVNEMTLFINAVIIDDGLVEGVEEADDAIAPLEEIKRMLKELEREETSLLTAWPNNVKQRVYGAIRWRLARIAYHKGLPYVDYSKRELPAYPRYTLTELQSMETIKVGQDANLKIETGDLKVWLSRMGRGDGAPYDNRVTVLRYIDDRWITVDEYQAR